MIETVDVSIAAEFVGHLMDEERDLHGPDGYRQWVEETRATFPDLEIAFDPVFAAAVVFGRWTFRGTHEGPMPDLGIEPTGRETELAGLFIDRLEGGDVVEMWHLMDNLTLVRQLGVLEPEAAGTA